MVEAVDKKTGEFRNLLDMRATVGHVTPGDEHDVKESDQKLTLEQTAPGRYEGSFEARETGAYVVTVEEHDGDTVKGLQSPVLVIPYSPEYQTVGTNKGLLHQVSDNAQGVFFPLPEDVYGKLRFGSRVLKDLWWILLLIGAVIFLADVAVRRILMPWDEIFALINNAVVSRLPAWAYAGHRAPAPRVHSAAIGSLLSVKEKVRGTLDGDAAPANRGAGTLPNQPGQAGGVGNLPGIQPPPAMSSSAASALLRKKREREGK